MTSIYRGDKDNKSNFIYQSDQLVSLRKVVVALKKEVNILERFGVSEVANFVTASTDKKYRGLGLATEMYRRSNVFLKASGYKFAQGVLTSPFTRKALSNLGYTELSRMYFKNVKNDDGQPLFPNISDEAFANLVYIEL